AVAAVEGLAHHVRIAGAAEGIIRPAVEHVDDRFDHVARIAGVDEVGHTELAAPLLLVGIDVDAHNAVGAGHLRALDHVEPDPAEAEHHDIVAGGHLGRIDHRTDAGRHAAADITAGLERGVLADLRH